MVKTPKPTEKAEEVEIVFIAGYHPFQFYSMIVFLVTIVLFVLYIVRWVFGYLEPWLIGIGRRSTPYRHLVNTYPKTSLSVSTAFRLLSRREVSDEKPLVYADTNISEKPAE